MILDNIENWEYYAGLGEWIGRGLEMLASGKPDALDEGKHELEGEKLHASVQQYFPKSADKGKWEAHRRYLDIQYLVNGNEVIGYCPVAKLRKVGEHNEKEDVSFFDRGLEVATKLKVERRMFAVFFPCDAHMPGLSLQVLSGPGSRGLRAEGLVKKIVLKVAL
jgi:YhcH/YjgK/YiaL family protein